MSDHLHGKRTAILLVFALALPSCLPNQQREPELQLESPSDLVAGPDAASPSPTVTPRTAELVGRNVLPALPPEPAAHSPDSIPPSELGSLPAPEGHASDVVRLDVSASHGHYLRGDDSPVYLQVWFRADRVETVARAPLNVGLVIDRSGSMAGGKLEDVKHAARWLVESLEDTDRVSVVSYAGGVRVDATGILSPSGRAEILQAIGDLHSGGGTYLSGGLETGALAVSGFEDPEFVDRIILLSDGNANEGVTDPQALAAMAEKLQSNGSSVTTMGVGVDYNELIMERVATAGGGNYYFIEDSSEAPEIFAAELDSLGGIVARDAVVEMTLDDDVDLDRVFDFTHRVRDRTVSIPLSALSAGQSKRVLISVEVPRSRSGSITIARGSLRYRDAFSGTEVVEPFEVVMHYTKDKRLHVEHLDEEVVEKLERVKCAQARRDAYALMDDGDFKGARVLVAARIDEARRANRRLKSTKVKQELKGLKQLLADIKAVADNASAARAYRSSSAYRSRKKRDRQRALTTLID